MVGRNKLIAVAKKVVSDSLGLVDFAIRLVNSVHNLPNWQVIFGRIQITEELQSILLITFFLRLVEMTFRLVHVRYSLPEWHPVILVNN